MTDGQALDSTTLADHQFPLRNDGVTIAQAVCPVCGNLFRPTSRRRYCSDGCRQAAFRRRHSIPKEQLQPPNGVPRSQTVYECPSCGSRYLGEQRCPDCQLFCQRIGPGGRCPHCDEPVALSDLVSHHGGYATQPKSAREVGHSQVSNWTAPIRPMQTDIIAEQLADIIAEQ